LSAAAPLREMVIRQRGTAGGSEALADLGTQLSSLYELMSAKFTDVIHALSGLKAHKQVRDSARWLYT
jgi:molybdenum-dependent DNA-binding transcriptional regulator ModE